MEKTDSFNLRDGNGVKFAWSYKDLLGTDPDFMQYKIPMYPNIMIVKKKFPMHKPERILKIKKEIAKQIFKSFVKKVKYFEWLAKIMPIPYKDEKVRMYINYRDLNLACPGDDFPLLYINLLVDNTAEHILFSFIV